MKVVKIFSVVLGVLLSTVGLGYLLYNMVRRFDDNRMLRNYSAGYLYKHK